MKRHPALQDLSRDHHVVLIQCQRIRKALGRKAPLPELRRLRDEFLEFYRADLAPHFQEEDEVVLAAALEAGGERLIALASALRREHEVFRGLVKDLLGPTHTEPALRRILAELEVGVTDHVRREEAEFFETLQASLSEAQLQDLWRRSHEFRVAHRSPQACGIRPPSR